MMTTYVRSGARVLRSVVCLHFFALTLSGCFSERVDVASVDDGGENCSVPASAIGAKKAIVTMRGYRFSPDTLRIGRGMTVTWVNCDNLAGQDAHTSTSDTGVWGSSQFIEGQSYARQFDAAGTFPYHCEPHPSMRAVIVVQ